jgi:hypothetical protein
MSVWLQQTAIAQQTVDQALAHLQQTALAVEQTRQPALGSFSPPPATPALIESVNGAPGFARLTFEVASPSDTSMSFIDSEGTWAGSCQISDQKCEVALREGQYQAISIPSGALTQFRVSVADVPPTITLVPATNAPDNTPSATGSLGAKTETPVAPISNAADGDKEISPGTSIMSIIAVVGAAIMLVVWWRGKRNASAASIFVFLLFALFQNASLQAQEEIIRVRFVVTGDISSSVSVSSSQQAGVFECELVNNECEITLPAGDYMVTVAPSGAAQQMKLTDDTIVWLTTALLVIPTATPLPPTPEAPPVEDVKTSQQEISSPKTAMGGVLAGSVLIVVALVVVFWWKRRRSTSAFPLTQAPVSVRTSDNLAASGDNPTSGTEVSDTVFPGSDDLLTSPGGTNGAHSLAAGNLPIPNYRNETEMPAWDASFAGKNDAPVPLVEADDTEFDIDG